MDNVTIITMNLKDPKPDRYGFYKYLIPGTKKGTVYIPASMVSGDTPPSSIHVKGDKLIPMATGLIKHTVIKTIQTPTPQPRQEITTEKSGTSEPTIKCMECLDSGCDECIYLFLKEFIEERESLNLEDDDIQGLRDRVDAGEHLVYCETCNDFLDKDQCIEKVYQCGECDEKINGDEGDHRCINCSRFAARAFSGSGCPDCLEEVVELNA